MEPEAQVGLETQQPCGCGCNQPVCSLYQERVGTAGGRTGGRACGRARDGWARGRTSAFGLELRLEIGVDKRVVSRQDAHAF